MIRVVQLNKDGDPINEPPKEFEKVEQGQKWAQEQRGDEELKWEEYGGFFALEGMTEKETEHLTETSEYPPVRFMIIGIDENGYDEELTADDFE